MANDASMRRLDALFSHVWMVRTFLKHCEEVEQDEDLQEIHRTLYDVMHALGPAWKEGDGDAYLAQAKKKLRRLEEARQLFAEIQPEVSSHTNFQMARQSLDAAVEEITAILGQL